MKISHCKIGKNEQYKFLELFVAEVTSRIAAELVGVNRRSYNALNVSKFRFNYGSPKEKLKFSKNGTF